MSGCRTAPAGGGFDAGELTGLLSEQRRLYVQLSGLADQQRSLITGDDPERLLAVLGDRQQVLDRLEALGRRLQPYQRNWVQTRARMSRVQEREVDVLVSEINRLLSAIVAKDEADAQLLAARKSSTSKSIAGLKTARQAGAAYAAGAGTSQSRVEWTDE